jgi:hypothetical protein
MEEGIREAPWLEQLVGDKVGHRKTDCFFPWKIETGNHRYFPIKIMGLKPVPIFP